MSKLAHLFPRHDDSRAAVLADSSSLAFFPQIVRWAGAGKVPGHGKDTPRQVFWTYQVFGTYEPALVIETTRA